MKEELKKIASLMDEFTKKYECKLELETYESKYVTSDETVYSYRLKAIQPEKIIAEA